MSVLCYRQSTIGLKDLLFCCCPIKQLYHDVNVEQLTMLPSSKNRKSPVQYTEEEEDSKLEVHEIDVSHLVTSVTHLTFEEGEIISSETTYFPDSTKHDSLLLSADVTSPSTFSSLQHGLEAVQHFEHEDPAECRSLLDGMKAVEDLMNDSICESTKKQYEYAYRRWITFCQENSLLHLPADVHHVGACVALVAKETRSVSAAETLSAAISYEHRKVFLPTPTQHPSHLLLMKSIRRNYSRDRTPAAPVTKRLLHRMIDHLFKDLHGVGALRAPVTLWRTVWRLLLQFHTLSRFADLIDLKVSSLKFVMRPEKHMLITFGKLKNDQYSEGSTKLVASNLSSTKYCPVLLTQLYLERLGVGYRGYLIPRVRLDLCKIQQADGSVPLSYTTALEDFRDLLTLLGENASSYSEHSGKRGGASAAAEAGMSATELQRFGGWRSANMAAKYTDLSVNTRLKLSRKLH